MFQNKTFGPKVLVPFAKYKKISPKMYPKILKSIITQELRWRLHRGVLSCKPLISIGKEIYFSKKDDFKNFQLILEPPFA